MPRKYVAEAIGTFALCFIGILAISGSGIVGAEGIANLASIGFAHGLTIAVMVAALGAVSGAHFNPAVTFGFVVSGRMSPLEGVRYWVSQLTGATAAGGLLVALFNSGVVAGATPTLSPKVGTGAGIVLEAIATFFLVLVVFGTAVDERAPKSVFPLAIGLTVALDIMAIGPLTGAAMNPARVFGPGLASGHWAGHWVYWVGPLAGGALAALVHKYVLSEPAAFVTPVADAEPASLKQAA